MQGLKTRMFTENELLCMNNYIWDNETQSRDKYNTRDKCNTLDIFIEYKSQYYWMCWIRHTIHSKDLWENMHLRLIMVAKWTEFYCTYPAITTSASFGINSLTFALHRNRMINFILNLVPV